MHFLLQQEEAWKVGKINLLLMNLHLVMLTMLQAFLWRIKVSRDDTKSGMGMEHSMLLLVSN